MSRRVARPYAVALFEVTRREGVPSLRELEEQLASVAQVFRRVPELLRFFEVPSVPPATKRALVDTIARTLGLRPAAHRMLAALQLHARLRYLEDIVASFRDLVDRKEGIVRGRVEVPVAPREEQVSALARALAEAVGGRVELEVKVRRELLAGFVVRLGSRVFDGSLLAQVRRFAAAAARR